MPKLASKVRTCLWYNGDGHEAAEFYVSLLPDSYFEDGYIPNPEKPPLVVEFMLCGAPFMILNGGPTFTHTPAASISVLTKDQTETDHLWSSLTANGGEESMCGWLKDRYGVSWQIVPEELPKMLSSDDKDAAQRAQAEMMKMKKLNIAALDAAFNQQ
ncbi:VOC family protein [Hyphococcus formosus]|uniref:VOC family protein n=1 Tax=Hyphococcus formosus TaxID=3143534 RepID=UPI00398AA098